MISIKQIDQANLDIYFNLAHSYEAEFSSITEKLPNNVGIFEPDTVPNDIYISYLMFEDDRPIGFCIANVQSNPHDIAEFYIVPVKRKQGLGLKLAEYVCNEYPGQWQIRQIQGATAATKFWRRVVAELTNGIYQEDFVKDSDWGMVTRQRFVIDSRVN